MRAIPLVVAGLLVAACGGEGAPPRAGIVRAALVADPAPVLDAPCTGTGGIRRHPDIRLLRRGSDVPAQAALQARLLDALWPLLAPGGRLVYATCSVLRDENDRQVEAFLARTADARAVPAVPAWFGRESGPGRQYLPGGGGLDGFFYAVLEKR